MDLKAGVQSKPVPMRSGSVYCMTALQSQLKANLPAKSRIQRSAVLLEIVMAVLCMTALTIAGELLVKMLTEDYLASLETMACMIADQQRMSFAMPQLEVQSSSSPNSAEPAQRNPVQKNLES